MLSDANYLFCRRCITKSTNQASCQADCERCVYEKYDSVDYKQYHLIKLIKKERMERLHPFSRLNTYWMSIYTLYVNQVEGELSV